MPKYTKGFEPHALKGHFGDHRYEVKAKTEAEYEEMADAFMGAPLPCGVLEGRRCSNGDRIRYEPRTNRFGVVDSGNVLRTFFRPDTLKHKQKSNADYACSEIQQETKP